MRPPSLDLIRRSLQVLYVFLLGSQSTYDTEQGFLFP